MDSVEIELYEELDDIERELIKLYSVDLNTEYSILKNEQDRDYLIILATSKIDLFYNNLLKKLEEQKVEIDKIRNDIILFDKEPIREYEHTYDRLKKLNALSNPILDTMFIKYNRVQKEYNNLLKVENDSIKKNNSVIRDINKSIEYLNERIKYYNSLSQTFNYKLYDTIE